MQHSALFPMGPCEVWQCAFFHGFSGSAQAAPVIDATSRQHATSLGSISGNPPRAGSAHFPPPSPPARSPPETDPRTPARHNEDGREVRDKGNAAEPCRHMFPTIKSVHQRALFHWLYMYTRTSQEAAPTKRGRRKGDHNTTEVCVAMLLSSSSSS